MKKAALLVRDVVSTAPDGASVRRTESVPVSIDFPSDFAPRAADGYFDPGDWRVVFAPELERLEFLPLEGK
jgi:hypothetical protein